MKETKKVLSAQLDIESIQLLKKICEKEKRSQAKMIEVMIDHFALKLKLVCKN